MYSFLPDKSYAKELIRPWKIFSFAIGMSWWLYGALNYGIADWDVGISLIMGVLTYLMAPWSIYIILSAIRNRPKYWMWHILGALLAWLFVVDWIYMLYHMAMGNQTFREANFYASSALYFLAGTIWLYRGSLKELQENLND